MDNNRNILIHLNSDPQKDINEYHKGEQLPFTLTVSDACDENADVIDIIKAGGSIIPVDENGRPIGTASVAIDNETGMPLISFSIEREMLEPPKKQTQLLTTDTFSMSTSIISKKQQEIALHGESGHIIPVGDVRIRVAMYREDNLPLHVSGPEKQLQDVVGSMIDRNGLPLYVSTEQLFREFSKRGADYKVTSEDLAFIDEIMRKLMNTHVAIDWREQADRYKSKNTDIGFSAHFADTLMPAKYERICNKNGSEFSGYKIRDYPAIYDHARRIGQIMSPSVALLQDTERNDSKKANAVRGSNVLRKTLVARYMLSELNDALETQRRKKLKEIICIINIKNVMCECDIEETPRKLRTVRSLIEDIIERWRLQPKSNVIKWEAIYERQKIISYKVFLSPKGTFRARDQH